MINSVSHDSVSCLVADRPMCFATALDKAFENIDCMSAILRCQAKNHIYESTQRLIQPRRVLWAMALYSASALLGANTAARYPVFFIIRGSTTRYMNGITVRPESRSLRRRHLTSIFLNVFGAGRPVN